MCTGTMLCIASFCPVIMCRYTILTVIVTSEPHAHVMHAGMHAMQSQPVHMRHTTDNMAVSTAAQRPLAVLPCQGQRSLQTNLRVQPHALRTPQATARRLRQGGHRVVCSAVADKPVVSNGAPASDFKAWESVITSVKQRDDIKTIMLFGAGPIVIGQVSTSQGRDTGCGMEAIARSRLV